MDIAPPLILMTTRISVRNRITKKRMNTKEIKNAYSTGYSKANFKKQELFIACRFLKRILPLDTKPRQCLALRCSRGKIGQQVVFWQIRLEDHTKY
jgi:hypothetical protein